jgi:putative ABC transport system substrate-binding protein
VTKNRVLLIVGVAIAAWAFVAWPQQAARLRVIGFLAVSAGPNDFVYTAIRGGLSDLGYLEGRDYRFEHRGAQGHPDRLPQLAQELVQLKVDVIVTGTEIGARAAKQATSTIPIVAIIPDDPVVSGLIESFNHPGGNVTGQGGFNTQMTSKRLQLLKDILPRLSRVTVLWDSSVSQELRELPAAAERLGIQLQLVEMKLPYDFDSAFADAKRQKSGAVMLLSSPQVYVRRTQLGSLALKHGLAVDAPFEDVTAAGGLMTYSGDFRRGFSRAAYFIDRLLKGAKPSELPFEQFQYVRFTINLKTARALGVTIPQAILLRADEVIE